nr:ATP-binding protein [Vibrio anguillarum]
EYLSRLKTLRQPLSDYIRCFRLIERAIKDGYSSKNPLSPSTVQYVHYLMDDRPQTQPYSGFFEPKADTITLIGESGTGKTVSAS